MLSLRTPPHAFQNIRMAKHVVSLKPFLAGSVSPTLWARLSADDAANLRQRAAWRAAYLVPIFKVLLAMQVALVLVTTSAVSLGAGGVGLALVVVVQVVAAVFTLERMDAARKATAKLTELVKPLGEDDLMCQRVVRLLQNHASVRRFRDQVVAHPRILMVGDAKVMQALSFAEVQANKREQTRVLCAQVHGTHEPIPAAG